MSILTEKRTWRREVLQPKAKQPRLTTEQIANVKRAVDFLTIRYGSPGALARAMGMSVRTMRYAPCGRHSVVRLAIGVAYVAGVKLDEITSGAWPRPGLCPMCGRG